MNWKRGLTRIYVLVWVLVAIAGALFTWDTVKGRYQPSRELQSFLHRHRGFITPADLRTKSQRALSLAIYRHAVEDSTLFAMLDDEGHAVPTDLLPAVDGVAPLERAVREANSDSFESIMIAWLVWVGLCLVSPAVVFGLLGWLIRGFEATP
jgi:hypothetical protein